MSKGDKVTIGAIAAVLIGVPLALWSRLPDPVATHFGPSGRPDGHLSKIVWLAGSAFFLWMLWVIYLVTRAKGPLTWRAPAIFGGIGVLIVGQAHIVWSNFDAASWTEAGVIEPPFAYGALAITYAAFALTGFLMERAGTRSLSPSGR